MSADFGAPVADPDDVALLAGEVVRVHEGRIELLRAAIIRDHLDAEVAVPIGILGNDGILESWSGDGPEHLLDGHQLEAARASANSSRIRDRDRRSELQAIAAAGTTIAILRELFIEAS